MVMCLKEIVNVIIESCKNILRYYNKCVDHGFAEYYELLWFYNIMVYWVHYNTQFMIAKI